MNNTFKISHQRTIEILEEHGLNFRMNTEVLNNELISNTSFFDYFGIQQYYVYREVMEWLGY